MIYVILAAESIVGEDPIYIGVDATAALQQAQDHGKPVYVRTYSDRTPSREDLLKVS